MGQAAGSTWPIAVAVLPCIFASFESLSHFAHTWLTAHVCRYYNMLKSGGSRAALSSRKRRRAEGDDAADSDADVDEASDVGAHMLHCLCQGPGSPCG